MHTIEIKGKTIGQGIPVMAVSLMGQDISSCEEELGRALDAGAECLEYRADFAADPCDTEMLVACARRLASLLPSTPLLFTFRSANQGGQASLGVDEYVALCRAVIADGAVDAIDIESWIGDTLVGALCQEARVANLVPVVSCHDCEKTPSVEEMVDLLLRFNKLGAGISKIAVCAHVPADALALMQAADQVRSRADTGPLIAIAMGAQGSITRVAGEFFGSALTFCSVGRASAPGQVDLAQAKSTMAQLHDILCNLEKV